MLYFILLVKNNFEKGGGKLVFFNRCPKLYCKNGKGVVVSCVVNSFLFLLLSLFFFEFNVVMTIHAQKKKKKKKREKKIYKREKKKEKNIYSLFFYTLHFFLFLFLGYNEH